MSVVDGLEQLINCDNTYEDIISILKKLVLVDSLGNVYWSTWDGSGDKECANFVNGDLQSVVLDGTPHDVYQFDHDLNTLDYTLVVRDENDSLVVVTDYQIDENSIYVIIDAVITGTWRVCAWS